MPGAAGRDRSPRAECGPSPSELEPEAQFVAARPLPRGREIETRVGRVVDRAAVADVAVALDRDLGVETVEHAADDPDAHRTEREVILELRVPAVEVRQPA